MRFSFAIMIFISVNLSAQDFFQRTYGGSGSEFGRGVVQTSDGGYACVGSTNSYADGSSNVYLIKVDEVGNYLWGRNIGGTGTIEWGLDIVEDSEGNLIIAGYTNNTDDANYDGLIIKLTAIGEVIWERTYGGGDWDFLETLDVDTDNSIYAVGNSFRDNSQKGWIIKVNENGDQIWEETIAGSGSIYLTGVSICNDENVGFVGYSINTLNQQKRFLSGAYQPGGNLNWSSSNPNWGDIEVGRCSCNSNGVVVSTGTINSNNDLDFYLVMQDIEFGQTILNARLASPLDVSTYGVDVLLDDRMAIVGSGEFIYFEGTDGMGVVRDEEGSFISIAYTIGFGFTGTDIMYDCFATDDGGYVAIGETNSYGNNYQILLGKVAANGDATIDNEDFLDLATTLNEGTTDNSNIVLFPNPTQAFTSIQSDRKIESISLSNLNGKILLQEVNFRANPEQINLSDLASGIYLLRIEYPNNSTSSHKLIKY